MTLRNLANDLLQCKICTKQCNNCNIAVLYALSYSNWGLPAKLSYYQPQDPMDSSLVKELLLGALLITSVHLYVV